MDTTRTFTHEVISRILLGKVEQPSPAQQETVETVYLQYIGRYEPIEVEQPPAKVIVRRLRPMVFMLTLRSVAAAVRGKR